MIEKIPNEGAENQEASFAEGQMVMIRADVSPNVWKALEGLAAQGQKFEIVRVEPHADEGGSTAWVRPFDSTLEPFPIAAAHLTRTLS